MIKKYDKRIRAVIYGRVSSDEQAKMEFSIPKIQLPECVKYIKEEGWFFIGSYVDEGFDCNSFERRAELQRMFRDIDNYDVVVCWSFDRLVGDDENTRGMIYHILDRNKKQITSVRQKAKIVPPDEYDPKSLDVAQRRQITDIGVSFDRKIRRERFMESRAKTVANGKHIAEPPFGYKIIRKINPKNSRRTIGYRLIDEEEASILKRIFNERANGKPPRRIAIDLNKDGIRARKGGWWTNARISQVLKNSYPCGLIMWNRTNHRKYGDESVRTIMPEEKWQFFPVNRKIERYYKPIISKGLFDKVQEIRNRARKILKGKASYSPNILSGLLRCPVCNRPMVETSFRMLKYGLSSYYTCSSHHNEGVCKNKKRIRAQDIKTMVLKETERYLNDPKELKEYQKQRREKEIEETQKKIISYERKLDRSQARLRSLNIKFIDGKIRENYYKNLLVDLENEEEGLKKTTYDAKEELRQFEKQKDMVVRLKDMGKAFSKVFKSIDNFKKKEILQMLIKEIVAKDNQVKIFFKV